MIYNHPNLLVKKWAYCVNRLHNTTNVRDFRYWCDEAESTQQIMYAGFLAVIRSM